jgi:proline racemase
MRKPRAMATTSVRSVDDVIAATGRRASVATPIPWVVPSQTTAPPNTKGDTDRAGRAAVVPEIQGEAYICGFGQWVIDERDPLTHGFHLRNAEQTSP